MSEYKWKPFTLLVSAEEVKGNEMKIKAKYDATTSGYKSGDIFEVTKQNDEEYYFIDNEGDERYRSKDEFTVVDDQPSPIRTVTRREIVPGVYGDIEVDNVNSDGVSLWLPRNKRWSYEELREAAHLLNQIAEVLEENGK